MKSLLIFDCFGLGMENGGESWRWEMSSCCFDNLYMVVCHIICGHWCKVGIGNRE